MDDASLSWPVLAAMGVLAPLPSQSPHLDALGTDVYPNATSGGGGGLPRRPHGSRAAVIAAIQNHLRTASTAGSTCAIIGTVSSLVLLVLMVVKRRSLNNFWNRVILQLTVALLMANAVMLITMLPMASGHQGLLTDATFCKVQGTLVQLSGLAGCLFNVALVVCLYLHVVHDVAFGSLEKPMYLLCWGIPLVLALLPLVGAFGTYQVAGAWCWIMPASASRLFALYIWVWVAYVVVVVGSISVAHHVSKRLRLATQHGNSLRRVQPNKLRIHIVWRMTLYPLMYILVWLPTTIQRVLESTDPATYRLPIQPKSSRLMVAQVVGLQIAGFMNLLVFLFCNAPKLCGHAVTGKGAQETPKEDKFDGKAEPLVLGQAMADPTAERPRAIARARSDLTNDSEDSLNFGAADPRHALHALWRSAGEVPEPSSSYSIAIAAAAADRSRDRARVPPRRAISGRVRDAPRSTSSAEPPSSTRAMSQRLPAPTTAAASSSSSYAPPSIATHHSVQSP